MSKPFELGILVGRFQTLHNGHKYMLDKALELCDDVGVFIGSSQEHGTAHNPFSYDQREYMLRRIYGDRLSIYPLPDIGVGNNPKWGDYVLENVVLRFGRQPDVLISGKEEKRLDWFDSVHGLSISELYIPKTIDISATRMREFFIAGDFDSWKQYTDPALWQDFYKLRETVMQSKDITATESR